MIDSPQRYDIKGKRYIDTPLKYYFTDLGLRNARLNFRQVEETHAMENIIFNELKVRFNELKVRGYNVDVGVVTSNEVSETGNNVRKQLEIDFVRNKGSKRYYIQSALRLTSAAIQRQEQRSLLKIQDGLKKLSSQKMPWRLCTMMTAY